MKQAEARKPWWKARFKGYMWKCLWRQNRRCHFTTPRDPRCCSGAWKSSLAQTWREVFRERRSTIQ